jgi:hypothetical protein
MLNLEGIIACKKRHPNGSKNSLESAFQAVFFVQNAISSLSIYGVEFLAAPIYGGK